ncbi:hypothetical protein UY3_19013 [Chelonia mydas]|uniref:Uncharacterized protein n=1 Tax=Chelonia mydas TaxID=8469 RepID=M7AGC5_CHEMY|nr:hypothetical protein UY3_19013 [Chelonia mydas]
MVAMSADRDATAPLVESPPEEASVGIHRAPAPLPCAPPAAVDIGAITALVTGGKDSGAAGTEFTSIFEEIEALGLIPVTQEEDDPAPVSLDLGADSVPPPPPPSPCPSLPAVAPALVLGAPLALPICLAADGTSPEAAQPPQATADAERSGPGPVGAPSTTQMEQLASPLERGPTEVSVVPDTMAAGDVCLTAPVTGVGEGPSLTLVPLSPNSGQEEPHPDSPASGDCEPISVPAPVLTPAPSPSPAPVPILAFVPAPTPSSVLVPGPIPAPDPISVPNESLGPFPATSHVIAAPEVVSFPLSTDNSQGAVFMSPLPNIMGPALFPPPPPPVSGMGMDCLV